MERPSATAARSARLVVQGKMGIVLPDYADRAAAKRAVDAMMQLKKIDIAAI